MTERERRVVGCMTGTSVDGLDVAIVGIQGSGLGLRARFIRGRSASLGTMAERLRAFANQQPATAQEIATLMIEFAHAHTAAIRELLAREAADLICIHGQTVYHAPPVSWQLFQPASVAHALSAPVVTDLRQADLTLGGQGAPITPLADWVLFRHAIDPGCVINLGGFANISSWRTPAPNQPEIAGGDICVCNQLLDAIARSRLRMPFDDGGREAARGQVDPRALVELERVLSAQSSSGRSLGTGDELARWHEHTAALPASVVLRTACEAIGRTIAHRVASSSRGVLLGGGGVRNAALVSAIRAHAPGTVESCDVAGVPPEYREAACFGVLGALCQDRVPITVPGVTGCRVPAPIAGSWVLP